MYTILVFFFSIFYDCFAQHCKFVFFEAQDSYYLPEWADSDYSPYNTPKFLCKRLDGRAITIFSPAHHSKTKAEMGITPTWIWVLHPLSNTPFALFPRIDLPIERVYIPKTLEKVGITSEYVWNVHWYSVWLQMNKDDASRDVSIWRVDEVSFTTVPDREGDKLLRLQHHDEEPMIRINNRGVLRAGASLDELTGIESISSVALQQLREYIDRLRAIMHAIEERELFETKTAKEVLFTHPYHSRDDNNQWVLGKIKSDENFMELPFIGKSKPAAEVPAAAEGHRVEGELPAVFSLGAIKEDGIILENTPEFEATLKFSEFTEYGFEFTLVPLHGGGAESHKIYWFQQVYGGCVLHALRGVLQSKGEELTETEFAAYSDCVRKPRGYCGRETKRRPKAMTEGVHRKVYDFCSAEAYLVEHGYHLLRLNTYHIKRTVEHEASGASAAASGDYEGELRHKMIDAFNALFDHDPSVPFLFIGSYGLGHAWTYMKMNTLLDRDGYWLSLESVNDGAARIDNIFDELKAVLLRSGALKGKYSIFAVYPPDVDPPPALRAIEDLWKPQDEKSKGTTGAMCSESAAGDVLSSAASEGERKAMARQEFYDRLIEFQYDAAIVDAREKRDHRILKLERERVLEAQHKMNKNRN